MTVSTTKTYNPVRDVIIKKALRLVGAYSPLSVPKGDQIDDAVEALNMMIKAWQIQGFMWIQQYVTLFLVPGQRVYSLPGANGASEYAQSTITAALVATNTVVTLADSSAMSGADVVGIYLADGSIHWDIIATVDTALQITLTTGVASAATSGAVIYAYAPADALYRPTRCFSAVRVNQSSNEVPLNSMSRDDYSNQVSKTISGTPVSYYFDPQLDPAKLYVWQPPTNASEILVLDVDRPLSVMVDSANTFDFPQEWVECIAYGLAVRLAPEYSVPLNERQLLTSEFAQFADNLMSYNRDWTSTFLGVNYHG